MGSILKRPFSKCINLYDEYKDEKMQNNMLHEKDKKNKLFQSNNGYQYISFLGDHSFMENQQWINSLKQKDILFYPEKLISAYSDYQFDQEAMEKRWSQIEFNDMNQQYERNIEKSICPKWKYLIRKGVSFEYMRKVILEMFKKTHENSQSHYQTVYQITFSDKVPAFIKNVPTFTEHENLSDVAKFHFLNEAGDQALKRLLWVFRKIELIEYSPLLTHVISFMLIFLNECETFCVVQMMIVESRKILKNKASSMKWHFTMQEEDHLKLSQSFFEKIKKKSLTGYAIFSHFEKINFDYTMFFHILSQNFFLDFLKISDIFKFYMAFLNEGIKIHFRIVYAICKVLKKTILSIYDQEILQKVIAEKCLTLTHSESHKLMKYAYKLNFSTNECFSSTKIRLSRIHNLKIYYMPHIEESSEFIGNEQFEIIWEWLPSIYRISDPNLVFKSTRDGFFLNNLYQKLKLYDKKPMLILIKTDENFVFGAFSNEMLNLENSQTYYGTNECFLFILQPKEMKFSSTGNNTSFIYSCKDHFLFGEGEYGPAFQIDTDLCSGRTNISTTYDNIPFTSKEKDNKMFCVGMEVYLIA